MNFKVRCIKKGNSAFTVGKIYEIEKGLLFDDDNFCFSMWSILGDDVIALNKFFLGAVEFELVEDKKVFTKADLKTGDVVKYRNGDVGIVFVELGSILFRDDSYEELEYFDDNLKICEHPFHDDYDIMVVRRPTQTFECRFRAFDNELGTLVYEREEKVEEMTIEEVCKALGKNVKIVEGA